ncbi:hypothetical protein GGI35DRAFT_189574 [Trichoderma velutinum]
MAPHLIAQLSRRRLCKAVACFITGAQAQKSVTFLGGPRPMPVKLYNCVAQCVQKFSMPISRNGLSSSSFNFSGRTSSSFSFSGRTSSSFSFSGRTSSSFSFSGRTIYISQCRGYPKSLCKSKTPRFLDTRIAACIVDILVSRRHLLRITTYALTGGLSSIRRFRVLLALY